MLFKPDERLKLREAAESQRPQQEQQAADREKEDKLKAEAEIRYQREYIEEFGHELRNPLTGILGNTAICINSLKALNGLIQQWNDQLQIDSERLRERLTLLRNELSEAVNSIQECGKQQQNVINDTLFASKLKTGMFKLDLAPFNPKEAVRTVIDMARAAAVLKGIELKALFLTNEGTQVIGDIRALKHILLNLVNNAIKFTDKGSVTIELAAEPQSDKKDITALKFRVVDTGIGLTYEEKEQLFKKFSQASIGGSNQYGSSGLGLYITKQLVDQMNGSIQVDSEKGKGTTFTVIIRLKSISQETGLNREGKGRESKSESEKVKPTALPVMISKRTILVAEDNAINQQLIKKTLETSGHQVIIVNNGAEAIRAWKERENIDIILMDLHMHTMGGIEATAYIREKEQERNCPAIPIIGLSAEDPSSNSVTVALERGMNDFIPKPYEKELLLQKIEHFTSLPKARGKLGTKQERSAESKATEVISVSAVHTKEIELTKGNGSILRDTKGIGILTAFKDPRLKDSLLSNEKLQSGDVDYFISDEDNNNLCYYLATDARFHPLLLKAPEKDLARLMMAINTSGNTAVKGFLTTASAGELSTTTILKKLALYEPSRFYIEGLKSSNPQVTTLLTTCKWGEMVVTSSASQVFH